MNSLKDRGFFKHMWLKVISLLLAILLWLIVMNLEDYSMTKTIRGIPVTQLNGETIEDMGKVYDVISGNTVDIVVKGPRSAVEPLKADSFIATADLSKLSITNSVQVQVAFVDTRLNTQVEISYINNTMNLTIEDRVTRELPIKAAVEGTPEEGYALGSVSVSPNIIQISGPESIVSRVTEVRATVNVTGQSASLERSVVPICMNAYGESMGGNSIEIGVKEAKVKVNIYPVKTVPVAVSTIGSPETDYVVTGINYNPQSITIAGKAEDLEAVDEIAVRDISVEDLNEDTERNIRLEDYLPDGIYLADSNDQLAINIILEKMVEKEIPIEVSDIRLLNMDDEYEYTLEISGVYKFRLKGLAADVDTVTKGNLELYLDLAGRQEGEHDVTPSYTKPNKVGVTVAGRMQLKVVKKEQETESEEGLTETTEELQTTGSSEDDEGN